MEYLLAFLILAYPLACVISLAILAWRIIRKKELTDALLIFCLLVIGYVVGFLVMHSDPYFYVDDHIREDIHLQGQILFGGALAAPFALIVIPLVIVIRNHLANRKPAG